ncbi:MULTISPECIES: DMT family transporter [unclassified Herbaspirillum]|uniref:DMT family transporter n=1 Tax=unclassified Herbaspirillum TaxID=2624150 RepID=UPI00114E0C33|nr:MULTISPECIES: DMT family transporter [unclassified Herbaspirillum]MBB5390372.1 drug/metabolite transporter (DMT)-like permease [Herbaspirillum sp. SJZ102]TQK09131.1 EamA domain-containing membrane protein RarD [Herbaspirillum sp. SJZ130]TQK14182.1 EamA domain-containing membrane protein RarD [Herbaspirillum sp. SJZ106]
MQHIPKPAIAALLLNTTIWGLSWTGMRALEGMGLHPLWATAAIFVGCTAMLLAIKRRDIGQLRRHPELLGVALATGLTNTAFNVAIAYGDVVRVILLFYLMPIWTVVLARVVLREAITARSLGRVALGLAGAVIVLYQPRLGLPLPRSLPDWLALLGGMCFAVNNVLLRRLHGVSDGARAISMLSGGALLACLLGVVLALSGSIAWPSATPGAAWPLVGMWSVLFLISNLCLQYGVARLPANITAVVMLAEILVASLSAWLLGAAELRPQDVVGGVFIIAAPWIIRDRRAVAPSVA